MQLNQRPTEKYILPKEYSFHGPFLVQERPSLCRVPRGRGKGRGGGGWGGRRGRYSKVIEKVERTWEPSWIQKGLLTAEGKFAFSINRKPVRDFLGRRGKNCRERKLFFHLLDSCSLERKITGKKMQGSENGALTWLLPFPYVQFSCAL